MRAGDVRAYFGSGVWAFITFSHDKNTSLPNRAAASVSSGSEVLGLLLALIPITPAQPQLCKSKFSFLLPRISQAKGCHDFGGKMYQIWWNKGQKERSWSFLFPRQVFRTWSYRKHCVRCYKFPKLDGESKEQQQQWNIIKNQILKG